MSTFTTSMFDSIKESLTKTQTQSGIKDILKFKPGNSYEVRLLPNLKSPEKTFHHYYTYGWESFATGQYINVVSRQTIGERDPISETTYRLRQHGTPEEKAKAEKIYRREQWLVNAYVVNDPTESENNDTCKIIRYGRQLHKVVFDAIEGEDADQFGARVFDLSDKGCNFRIRCDKQGDYPSYVASKFLMPSAIPGLSDSSHEKLYDSITELDSVFTIKTYDELNEVLDEHFYCRSTATTVAANNTVVETTETTETTDVDLDEDVPMEFDNDSSKEKKKDDDIDIPEDLLAGLDDL